jgi:flagellar assembly protein FliH
MDKIINSDTQLKKHRINKYVFRSLDDDSSPETHLQQTSAVDNMGLPIDNEMNSNNKDSEIYSNNQPMIDLTEVKEIKTTQSNMLKVVEEMSKIVQILKGDFDNQNKSINEHFEKNIQQTYENAVKTGESEALKQHEVEITQIKTRLIEAIDALNTQTENCKSLMSNLENELVKSSIEIAKDIIQVNIEEKHEQVALSLANLLIVDLKDAVEIKIKVNPIDLAYLKQHIVNDKIKIEADNAIATGGVIILSNLGNIDGTIKERLAKVKSTFYESLNNNKE